MNEKIQEIKNRLSKATKGKWSANDFSVITDDPDYKSYNHAGYDKSICSLYDGEYIENPNIKNDGNFIANAKEDIEYLLSLLKNE